MSATVAPEPALVAVTRQTVAMTRRHLTALSRQPSYVAITLVQPLLWLVLLGAVFRRIVELPGFATHSYVTFLTPGIVMMTAISSSAWAGMGLMEDIQQGVMDRFLVSPARRGPLINGRLLQQALVTMLQAVILVTLGLAMGGRWGGGFGRGAVGVAVLMLAAALVGSAFVALSYALALAARGQESFIAVANFVVMPLTFLSSAFMDRSLLPGWVRGVAAVNPVNWALDASRAALTQGAAWGPVGRGLAALAVLTLAAAVVAVRAFRAYQRSI